MKIEKTTIKDCYVIHPDIIEDERGWFMRVFCDQDFNEIKKGIHFKQINHSFNKDKGTFRGMHYQTPPHAEDKLIRCISGGIVDFVLDIRKDSSTFLHHIAVELNPKNKCILFLPKGVAHGFQTTENNTELIYHHTEAYNKTADRGLRYNDPKININLPIPLSVISDKDKNQLLLTNDFYGITI